MVARGLARIALLGALVGAVAAGLTACGHDDADPAGSSPDTASDTVSATPAVASGPLVDCGVFDDVRFPVSALARGVPTDQHDQIADGLRRMSQEMGADGPAAFQHGFVDRSWHVLSETPTRVAVATGRWTPRGPAGDGQMWVLDRQDGRWAFEGGGDCRLEAVAPDGHVWNTITAPAGGLDRTSRSPLVLLTLDTCGRPGPLDAPAVSETTQRVVVTWSSPRPKGGQACPGYAPLRRHLHLSAPLGDRPLLDASRFPFAVVR